WRLVFSNLAAGTEVVAVSSSVWAIAGFTFHKFISQEVDNGVPKENNPVENENYSYEISFTDDESLLKKEDNKRVLDKDKRKRVFFHKTNIAIKDNSYSAKLEQLKNQSNLMKEEQAHTKYKEGKKFIEDLEAELNKKTGKEAIVNRTSQQEQELKDKKQELAELEKRQSQDPKKAN
ncbi:1256_t:CDS:2, partial [Cetraspora pellucida]